MVVKTVKSWSSSARITVLLLVLALGATLVTSSLALQRSSRAVTELKTQSKCNADWKKAYRAAQPPRLAAQKANLESQLKFFLDIRTLTRSSPAATPQKQAENRKKLDESITAAYNAVRDQLNAQAQNTYPTDECGRDKPKPAPKPIPSLTPSKEKPHGKASVDSGGTGGGGSPTAHSSQRVGLNPPAGRHSSSGGGGSSTGNNGGQPPVTGRGGSPVPPGIFGPLFGPLCSLLLVIGCSS